MRRSRVPSSPSSPYRALAHHHASGGGQQAPESVSSLIRSFNGETNPTRPMRPSPLTASTIADMPLELVDRIRSFPLFMSAPDEFLAAIGKHLRIQVHSAHDHILNEGDDARAMYWLVRGFVAVTSRDGEAVYAELKPGAFFGEIGVLMDVPRTATIIARSKCMLAVLKKEDLQAELPNFPDMEKAIRQEAQERLTILKKKQQERGSSFGKAVDSTSAKAREAAPGQVSTGEVGTISDGAVIKSKKRKSPSPGIIEDPAVGGSALTSGYFNVRKTLKELPLFSTLPTDILHFLGLSAQLKTYPPFTDIVQQGSSGQEIYFIVRGEAEVIHEEPEELSPTRTTSPSGIRPRLMQGQYFGEVASLGLSQGRTATVRSITTVECLMIGGDALDELWRRCPPDLRQQVEQTAKTRYQKSDDGDLEMEDVGHRESTADAQRPATPQRRLSLPQVVFTTPSKPASPANDESETRQPSDPDPFLSVDMENLRNRRRNSLAPPTPQSEPSSPPSSIHGSRVNSIDSSPLKFFTFPPPTPTEDEAGPYKKARILPSRPRTATSEIPQLTDEVLVGIFQQLNFMELIRMRAVSRHWRQLLSESPKLCTHVDLSPFNRQISDWALVNIVAPFIGTRPVEIDISNCFHVSDEGFQALWKRCGQNVKVWRMKSVWEVSATQILDMSENAKGLEEIDWSNCRKVGDNLLARVVGWVVPEPAPAPAPSKNVVISSSAARKSAKAAKKPASTSPTTTTTAAGPAPGSVVGCPNLKRLNLSYCKHITDRSMAHLAAHASPRLTSLSLTRCTSITDAGFQAWAPHHFSQLRRLCLADCTYLSDNAVVALVNAAKNLTHLDLSFCCALSDTATEVVALGLQRLRELRLAFCGSAVSDASLGCVALHLHELRGLSVRGCVRVTGVGVENVLEGCGRLEWLDVSQCKNLAGWLAGGGVSRWGVDERGAVVDAGAEEGGGVRSLRTPTAGAAGAGAAGGRPARGGGGASGLGAVPPGQGPVMRPIIPPRGVSRRRVRPAVRFVVEKGDTGLR